MFRYLMPELFLPLCRESLLWESARFASTSSGTTCRTASPGASRKRLLLAGPGSQLPLQGPRLRRLALRRGMGAERVVSPYSSFLALAVEPRAAVRNLRRLCALGFTGRFEALGGRGLHSLAQLGPRRQACAASWRTTWA